MIGNVAIAMDPDGNLKPNKSKSQNKIDDVVALVNAIAAHMMTQIENEIFFNIWWMHL